MTEFLEIGEVVKTIPNPIKILPIVHPKVVTPVESIPMLTKPSKSNKIGVNLLYIGLGISVGVLLYYILKPNEDTDTSNKL